MTSKELQDLIDFIAKSGMDEVKIETDKFKIAVRKNAPAAKQVSYAGQPQSFASAPAAQPSPEAGQAASTAATEPAPQATKLVEVKAPMIGTFYRSPNPESESFVNVGDTIKAGETVCIIEAMKLFNDIESDVSGKIVKVLVDDATPVEYDQPLFLVEPS